MHSTRYIMDYTTTTVRNVVQAVTKRMPEPRTTRVVKAIGTGFAQAVGAATSVPSPEQVAVRTVAERLTEFPDTRRKWRRYMRQYRRETRKISRHKG